MVNSRVGIVDCVPLLYILIGKYCTAYNIDEKRIRSIADVPFTIERAKLLAQALPKSKLVTPHILAEFSNWAKNKVGEQNLAKFLMTIKTDLEKIEEKPKAKEDLLMEEQFYKYGLTDIGILKVAQENNCLIFTSDRPLKNQYESLGGQAEHILDLFERFKNMGLLKE